MSLNCAWNFRDFKTRRLTSGVCAVSGGLASGTAIVGTVVGAVLIGAVATLSSTVRSAVATACGARKVALGVESCWAAFGAAEPFEFVCPTPECSPSRSASRTPRTSPLPFSLLCLRCRSIGDSIVDVAEWLASFVVVTVVLSLVSRIASSVIARGRVVTVSERRVMGKPEVGQVGGACASLCALSALASIPWDKNSPVVKESVVCGV